MNYWNTGAMFCNVLRAQFGIQFSCKSLNVWIISSISFQNLTIRPTQIGCRVDYFLQCVFSAARIFLLLQLDLAYTELPYGTTLLYLTLALLVLSYI